LAVSHFLNIDKVINHKLVVVCIELRVKEESCVKPPVPLKAAVLTALVEVAILVKTIFLAVEVVEVEVVEIIVTPAITIIQIPAEVLPVIALLLVFTQHIPDANNNAQAALAKPANI
jgi:hypothetical protein